MAFGLSLALGLGALGPSRSEANEKEDLGHVVEVTDPAGLVTEEAITVPPVASVVEGPISLEISVGQSVYQIENPGPGSLARVAFDQLNAEEKQAFHTNRRLFLAMLARGLNLMKYGFGMGVVVKDRVQFSFREMRLGRWLSSYRKTRLSHPSQLLAKAPPALMADETAAETAAERDRAERTRRTLSEKSHEVILGMIKAVDENLWLQAPLFANSNEFGLLAAGGVEMLGGQFNKGWGGLVDVGVSIGFNRKEQSLVLQIFTDKERFKSSALPAVFITGLVFKSGFYIANQREGVLDHHGTSFYPPLAPAFASITQDNFMTGVSSGLTWPPSPLGDMLTYMDQLDQHMVLRVTVSPLQKGFVRVQTALGSSAFKVVAEPVKKALAFMKALFKKWTCGDFLDHKD